MGNLGKRVAEQVRVVERNRHDCRNLGRSDDVGGIEPAAKPHLEHHDIAADVREMHERHGGHQLELGGVLPAFRFHRLSTLAHTKRCSREVLIRDVAPVHTDALMEGLHVGAREKPRLKTRLRKD